MNEIERLARPLDPEAWEQWDKHRIEWLRCEATMETVRVVLEGLRKCACFTPVDRLNLEDLLDDILNDASK